MSADSCLRSLRKVDRSLHSKVSFARPGTASVVPTTSESSRPSTWRDSKAKRMAAEA
jgi:hypothetical protein